MAKRTNQQNKSLHVFCEQLAEKLNANGLDMKATLKPWIEIPWTKEMVKEHLWKPVQLAMTDNESTTEMETTTPVDVHEKLMSHLNAAFSDFDIDVPWPCLDELRNNQYSKGKIT